MDQIDLVVIRAGFHGLIFAKTYLDVHPSANVTIYNTASSVGGVWAKENLYPGLKTNNMLGTYEFSDYPMDSETYGVKIGEHIPGTVVHRYLTNFAEHFGIYKRIRFGMRVESAERRGGEGWVLTTSSFASSNSSFSPTSSNPNGVERTQVLATKLIVATSLMTDPIMPKFQGREDFEAPVFHSKYFGRNLDTLETAERVTVLGGMKSAFDVAYAYASRGVRVDMVVRESGHGPIWIAPPHATPIKLQVEKLITTRLITGSAPATFIGRYLINKFWSTLESDILHLNDYDSHPETAKFKLWTKMFFIGSINGVLNYENDIFDLVRNGTVRVHISDIASLGRKTVNLMNGEMLRSDNLICCTGWKHTPPLTFLPAGIETSLGLPHSVEPDSRFPSLRDAPPGNLKGKPLPGVSPRENMSLYQLYRFMVLPSFIATRDIAFAGHMLSILTPTRVQIQALWTSAFFSDEMEEVRYEAVLWNRLGRWSFPQGWGVRFPESVFEEVAYLGCKVRRKGSW
ncbi:hypothetical protein BKA61DRAFT_686841 [Leptodontidium sp. MPI-SDFR-AT-0119]|nr:hypothetical protein BKA61DRAFT_686841 [Leptodontidium sp. MPI-SDFR-AT-0119]